MDRNVSAFDVLAVSALVALRKESVDRNCISIIELLERRVALRKESVDSKVGSINRTVNIIGRSPQGERG